MEAAAELKMTTEEAAKLFNDNPVNTLAFAGYYKYSFEYMAETETYRLWASYGGGADDIYRERFDPTRNLSAVTFEDLSREISFLVLIDKKTGAKFIGDSRY